MPDTPQGGSLAHTHEGKPGLPRGRSRLPARAVRASQVQRLCRAAIAAVAEGGYADVTVADIVRRAKVSRVAFYTHFRTKEDCFLAATREGGQLLADRVVAATRAVPPDAPDEEVLRAACRAFLQFLADEPAFARAFYIGMPTAGPRAVARFDAAERRFAEMTATWHRRARARHPDWPAVPDDVYLAIAGAIAKLVRTAVRNGQTDALPKMEDTLLSLNLSVLAARPWPPADAWSLHLPSRWAAAIFFGMTIRQASVTSSRISSRLSAAIRRVHPVEALVRQPRHGELVRLGRDQRGPFLFREPEAHRRLVGRDRHVDDLADPELDVVVDQVLGSARQRHRHRAHVRRRDHVSSR